jgi:hypothetical protein
MARSLAALWLAAITAISYFVFPGHTYLHSDTQIYLPILEHLYDPTLFRHDILAQYPHVRFTAYDEISILLRRLTGLGFESVWTAQQLLCRFAQFLGAFLIGRRLGLPTAPALALTALLALGATITGPAVLLLEYEPVPRGFAVGLLLLATGLAVSDRGYLAGVAAGLATLYHPPTAMPFWAVYPVAVYLARFQQSWRERLRPLPGMIGGLLLLLLLAALQPEHPLSQPLVSRIPADIIPLQQFRAAYNWFSLWDRYWIWHYAAGAALVLLAIRQLGPRCPSPVRIWLLGLAAVGLSSMPASYLLLDLGHWSLIPQIQPARAALFIVASLMLAAGASAYYALIDRKWLRGFAWLVLILAIPTQNRVADLLAPWTWDTTVATRAAVVAALAAIVAAAIAVPILRVGAVAVLALVPAFVIPTVGRVQNYPNLNRPEIDELARWARTTPRDAVFLFPDVDRSLETGIFRAHSLRAIYVDRKGGGQVNFLPAFAREWWRRWQLTMSGPILTAGEYRLLGIDYVVITKGEPVAALSPIYTNSRYTVYLIP